MALEPTTTPELTSLGGEVITPDDNYSVHRMPFHTNITLSVFLLSLGGCGVVLNFGVLMYYRKSYKELIPFVYFTLGVSDFCTGIATLSHSLALACLAGGEDDAAVYLSLIASILTVLTFRVSVFVSLTIAIIRSINIASPFTIINKRIVVGATFGYMAFWAVYVSLEIMSHFFRYKDLHRIPAMDLITILYMSRTPKLLHFVYEEAVGMNHTRMFSQKEKCTMQLAYVGFTIFIPTFLTFLSMSHQVFHLRKPSTLNCRSDRKEKRRITLTIVMITSAFIVTSIVTFIDPIVGCGLPDISSYPTKVLVSYLLGTVPMFINAFVNPFILIVRGTNLRKYITDKITKMTALGSVRRLPSRSGMSTSTGGNHNHHHGNYNHHHGNHHKAHHSRHNTLLSILSLTSPGSSPKNRVFPGTSGEVLELQSPGSTTKEVSFQTFASEQGS